MFSETERCGQDWIVLYNTFEFWENRYFHSWRYSKNQKFYGDFFSTRYKISDQTKEAAKISAKSLKTIKRRVEFTFRNRDIPLKNIGIVHKNYPVWVKDKDFLIAEFPERLKGSVLVDNQHVLKKTRQFFMKEEATGHKERFVKLLKNSNRNLISLLPRRDLRISAFMSEKSAARLLKKDETLSNIPKIVLRKKQKRTPYFGVEITNQSIITWSEQIGDYFMVIFKDEMR